MPRKFSDLNKGVVTLACHLNESQEKNHVFVLHEGIASTTIKLALLSPAQWRKKEAKGTYVCTHFKNTFSTRTSAKIIHKQEI